MKFTSIQLIGFAGVSDKVSLDLSADVTVLVAANGFGKSSICDASAWALSGRHPRGADPRNLYSRSGETQVSLSVIDPEGSEWIIRRRVSNSEEKSADKLVTIAIVEQLSSNERRRGDEAEAWILSHFLAQPDTASRDTDAKVLTDAYYLQQESLREFLTTRSDTDRFTALSRMVGAGVLADLVSTFESAKNAWSRATTKIQSDVDVLSGRLERASRSLQDAIESAELIDGLAGDREREVWRTELNSVLLDAQTKLASDHDFDNFEKMSQVLRKLSFDISGEGDQLVAALAEVRLGSRDATGASLEQITDAELAQSRLQIQVLHRLREELGMALDRAESDWRMKQTEINQLAALARQALSLVSSQCPTCGQAVDEAELAARLLAIVAASDESSQVDVAAREKVALARAENNLILANENYARLQDRFNRLTEQEAVAASLRDRRTERLQRLADLLRLDAAPAEEAGWVSLVSARVDQLNRLKERIEGLLNLAKQFQERIPFLSVLDALPRIRAEVASLEAEYATAVGEVDGRQRTATQGDILLKALRADSENFLVDRLREIQPILDQLYSAIDPHPTFRSVTLTTQNRYGKNRLAPIVVDDSTETTVQNPGQVLSTSQANALAVTLFLAFNLGLGTSNLETVVLDDPLQNLDNVHLLGLVDMLRRLTPYRQMIVTTHDPNFATLLARKMRPVGVEQSFRLIRITKWDRFGPALEEEVLAPDLQPIKIAVG